MITALLALAQSAWLLLIAAVCVACITYTLTAEARSRREKPNPLLREWRRQNRKPGDLRHWLAADQQGDYEGEK